LIVIVPAVALRVEDVFFAKRVHDLMSSLSGLRIDATSKPEALPRIPGLRVVDRSKNSDCGADECFAVTILNSRLSGWVLLPILRSGHKTLYRVLRWYGFQCEDVMANVNFKSGKVSDFRYMLESWTSDRNLRGELMVRVSSVRGFADRRHREFEWDLDESPDYRVWYDRKWGGMGMGVDFTRNVMPDLVRHAFDPHFGCLWSFGCENAKQILPKAEQYRLAIESAAIDRMKGPLQCPDRILAGRVRDVEDISLVEVKSASPMIPETDDTYAPRIASFRLLRVLKGTPRPLDNLSVSRNVLGPGGLMHNSGIDLLNPGQRLLLFSGEDGYIREPCQVVAATEDAVRTIEKELTAAAP
jgi:hypothetical protein